MHRIKEVKPSLHRRHRFGATDTSTSSTFILLNLTKLAVAVV